MDEQSERRLELKRQFGDFLDQDHGLGTYPDKIKALLTRENISKNRLRLEVDVHDLRQYSDRLYGDLLADPAECIPQFEDALGDLVRNANPKALQVGPAYIPVLSHQLFLRAVASQTATAVMGASSDGT